MMNALRKAFKNVALHVHTAIMAHPFYTVSVASPTSHRCALAALELHFCCSAELSNTDAEQLHKPLYIVKTLTLCTLVLRQWLIMPVFNEL